LLAYIGYVDDRVVILAYSKIRDDIVLLATNYIINMFVIM